VNRGRFVIVDCVPGIGEEFLCIWGAETEREHVYCQLYGGGGEDELGPGVFSNWERLVEGPGEGFAVEGVGRGWRCLVGYCERDGSPAVYQGREAKREMLFFPYNMFHKYISIDNIVYFSTWYEFPDSPVPCGYYCS